MRALLPWLSVWIVLLTAPCAALAAPAPEGLRAEVYSATAAELFWQRVDGRVAGYEITRNGASLGTVDALSFFDAALQPGTDYTYTIASVERDGTRSESVMVELSTRTVGDGNALPAPAGVRVTLYSSTAAELFWQRVDGPVGGYEITRDGQLLGIFDSLSYFDDKLQPRTTYTYTLRTIGPDGNRSESATVMLDTGKAGGSNGDDALPVPQGLRVLNYSSTASEVFWDRANTPGLRYEISLDGVPLGESGSIDGTSWFIDMLEPGSISTFTIRAVNSQGLRSAALDIVIETPLPFELDSPITTANLETILNSVLAVPKSNGHTQVVVDVDALTNADSTELAGLTLVISEVAAESFTRTRFECDAGGTFEHQRWPTVLPRFRLILDECVYAGRRFSGKVLFQFDGVRNEYQYRPLEVVSLEGGDDLIVDGLYLFGGSRFSNLLNEAYIDFGYSIEGDAGITVVSGLAQFTQFPGEIEPTNDFNTQFEINAPWTNNHRVAVSTIERFENANPESGLYPIGQLQIIHATESNDEGNTLVIDANTGNLNTFTVTLDEQGAVTSDVRNWGDYPTLPCVLPGSDACLGR